MQDAILLQCSRVGGLRVLTCPCVDFVVCMLVRYGYHSLLRIFTKDTNVSANRHKFHDNNKWNKTKYGLNTLCEG